MGNRQYYVDQWLRRDASDAGMDVAAFEERILAIFRSGNPQAEEFQSPASLREWIGTSQGASAYASVMNRTAATVRMARRMAYDIYGVPPADDPIRWESMLEIAERLYHSADRHSAPPLHSR